MAMLALMTPSATPSDSGATSSLPVRGGSNMSLKVSSSPSSSLSSLSTTTTSTSTIPTTVTTPRTCRAVLSIPAPIPAVSSFTHNGGKTATSKRPRLSLNTSNTTITFGKKSTSLRLETLSATSPTSLNTFSNGYATLTSSNKSNDTASSVRSSRLALSIEAATSSSSSVSLSSSPTTLRTPEPTEDASEDASQFSASSSSGRSTSSSSFDDFSPRTIPYKQSFSLPSILRNGPLPRPLNYKALSSRPIFPAAKRVCFRTPLTEDVVTVQSTLSPLALFIPADSTVNDSTSDDEARASPSPRSRPAKLLVSETSESSGNLRQPFAPSTANGDKKGRHAGDKRESPTDDADNNNNDDDDGDDPHSNFYNDDDDDDDDDDENLDLDDEDRKIGRDAHDDDRDQDACPQTPIAGRRKRVREWRWTLGDESVQEADGDEKGHGTTLASR